MNLDPYAELNLHDNGPEWWAMDHEYFCDYCGHSAHDHAERFGNSDPAPCRACACEDFESEAADNPLDNP